MNIQIVLLIIGILTFLRGIYLILNKKRSKTTKKIYINLIEDFVVLRDDEPRCMIDAIEITLQRGKKQAFVGILVTISSVITYYLQAS